MTNINFYWQENKLFAIEDDETILYVDSIVDYLIKNELIPTDTDINDLDFGDYTDSIEVMEKDEFDDWQVIFTVYKDDRQSPLDESMHDRSIRMGYNNTLSFDSLELLKNAICANFENFEGTEDDFINTINLFIESNQLQPLDTMVVDYTYLGNAIIQLAVVELDGLLYVDIQPIDFDCNTFSFVSAWTKLHL